MPAHSPKGASSAERWMNCPGSTALIKELRLPASDNPEYREAGTAAHEALALCLVSNTDGWTVAGDKFNGIECDPEMVAAIQVFLDDDRAPHEGTVVKEWTEAHLAHPEFHPDFYGTIDRGKLITSPKGVLLRIRDFKYGAGIAVEAEWNPQIMYYAYEILIDHPEVTEVDLGIVQPRITWHPGGVIRTWTIDAPTLRAWAEGTLRPAMVRADSDEGLQSGDWCRFCPAKLVCPLLTTLFGAAARANAREIVEWDDAAVDRNYPLVAGVEHYIRALEADAFRRASNGVHFENMKVVNKKANRVWKPEAETILLAALGNDKIYTAPTLKSPAQIELLGAVAAAKVSEYAYIPESGLTLARRDDNRHEVKVQSLTERFQGEKK